MILILSNNDDWSTNDVVEWLHAKEAYFQRLNFDSLPSTICEISINNETSKTSIVFKDKLIDSQKIDIIWFRRSAKPSFLSLQNSNFAQNGFGRQLVEFVASESKYFFRAFFHAIGSNKKWLNNFLSAHNDKFDTLLKAQQLGIDIPTTFLTFSKAAALNFIDRQDSVIMKPIYNIDMFMIDDQRYMPYTKRVVKEDFDNFDENIFPILLQKEIKKKYEVRSFYLDGKFYSMAIFSQQSEQTEVDFRKYNYIKPNRRVSYVLPDKVEKNLKLLMNKLNLNSGSIDLIRSSDGKYIFLEVNPVGQFGMVSYPCNYYLEEKIANFLIDNQ